MYQLVKEKLGDNLFIVVSNREPYIHTMAGDKIVCNRPVSGLTEALDPVMRASQGTWVAWGSGDADRKAVDSHNRVAVPSEEPEYTLRRVWLTEEEVDGFYLGFANEALWPLCHMAFQRPVFRKEDWDHYVKVNRKFAQAVIEEIGDQKAFIWIQDYHLCILPKFLKEMAPNQLIVAQFWHIPWPNYEAFRICPQKKEILEGLLANDLLGFHIRYHCDNFWDVIDREIESKIDRERFSVVRGEHETLIRPYPISVDYEGINEISGSEKVAQREKVLAEEYGTSSQKILLGLDRIDYTKGIPERLLAVDCLLENHPELKKKFIFLQMGEISRLHIPKYKDLNDEINALVEEINWKHSTNGWQPIILMRGHLSFHEILAFYRISDICVVSSLHDGMNLVAKEFISSRSDEKGMLILSQFTGAARELTDAVLVNPYDREQFSEGIFAGLNMPDEERIKRIKKMREIVQDNNIFRWAGKIISELLKFEFKE